MPLFGIAIVLLLVKVFIERKNVYFCADKPQIVTHKNEQI